MQLQCVRCGFRGDVNVTRSWGVASWVGLLASVGASAVVAIVLGGLAAYFVANTTGPGDGAAGAFGVLSFGAFILGCVLSVGVGKFLQVSYGKCRNCNFDFGKL